MLQAKDEWSSILQIIIWMEVDALWSDRWKMIVNWQNVHNEKMLKRECSILGESLITVKTGK